MGPASPGLVGGRRAGRPVPPARPADGRPRRPGVPHAGSACVVWDGGWYGGHHVPGYSLLFPPLAGVLGVRLTGALAAVAAAVLFARLAPRARRARRGPRGHAVVRARARGDARQRAADVRPRRRHRARRDPGRHARAALVARRRWRWSPRCASPVAGAFVALAAAAWWRGRAAGGGRPRAPRAARGGPARGRRLRTGPRARRSSSPRAAPSRSRRRASGRPWPSRVGLALALGPRERVLRAGAVLYALALVASFVLRTPMGGNAVRLGALMAGPVAALALWDHRRRLLALAAVPLLWFGVAAAVDDWYRASQRPVGARVLLPAAAWPSSHAGPAPRGASRSRSPTTTGRRAGWRRTSRWRAAGSASSTSPATACSTTGGR